MSLGAMKNSVLSEIDRRSEELTKLCSELIQIPSENPPGDTGKITEFVAEFLSKRGLTAERYSPKNGRVNLVSRQGTSDRPCLILNGHLDVFPAGGKGWLSHPFSGEVNGGRILGRGATDMKAGVAASLFAFAVISDLKLRLPGRLILILVADEETGGRWGTQWLLENVPGLVGDACLIGEPGGIDSIVFGEKGRCQFKVKAVGITGHSPMPIRTENAIVKMAQLIPAINALKELPVETPTELAEIIRRDKALYDQKIGKGAGDVLDHLTVNVGIIRGGRNINTVPDECEVDIDVTLPAGITPDEVLKQLEYQLQSTQTQNIHCEFIKEYPLQRPALYTPTTERITKLTYNNVRALTGITPTFFMKHWGTDAKFFRKKGIPTIIYGTSEMTAEPNEYVLTRELCTVTKVHAATILDFLFNEPT